jgi:transposase-like protein
MRRKGPARDLKKELYWRKILREHRQSGFTIRDFCRQKGLAEPLFYAWRREVQRRDQPSVGARWRTGKASRPVSAQAVRPGSSKTAKPKGDGAAFVSVKLSDVALSPANADAVECHFPSGAVLRMPPGMEPAAVAALVRAWEQGRC